MKWRGFSGRDRRGEGLGGSDRCGIFVFVGPDAIAVLEVDPQILDGLRVQLAADALVDFCGDVGLQVERLGQLRRGPAVGGQRLSGLLGPVPDRFRVVAVGGDVHRVHRLPPAAVAWVCRCEGRVSACQPGVEFIRERVEVVSHGKLPRWARRFRIVEIVSG